MAANFVAQATKGIASGLSSRQALRCISLLFVHLCVACNSCLFIWVCSLVVVNVACFFHGIEYQVILCMPSAIRGLIQASHKFCFILTGFEQYLYKKD